MFDINRDVVIIKPLKPFIDWANAVDPYEDSHKAELDDYRKECTTFLIPECYGEQEAVEFIEMNYKIIFENELEGMYTDESLWPQILDLEMFREWFEIEYNSMVFDMLDAPIEVVDD